MISHTLSLVLMALAKAHASFLSDPAESLSTFSISATPNPRYLPNRHAATQRSCKYGNCQIVNRQRRSNGTVPAIPQGLYEAEYTGTVSIGQQQFNLSFDTASADLWVFSDLLPLRESQGHNIFNRSKSTTYKSLVNSTWTLPIADRSAGRGVVGVDTISVGRAVVAEQAVQLASSLSSDYISDLASDGVFGLAYSSINNVLPHQQKTFFENIAPSLDRPVFAVDLKHAALGSFDFGFIDDTKFSGSLYEASYNPSNGVYEFDSVDYTIDGQMFQNQAGNTGILDSGSTLIFLNSPTISKYYAKVPGAHMDQQEGVWLYPCNETLPNFTFTIGTVPVVLSGEVLRFAEDNNECVGGLQDRQELVQDVYGTLFFKAYYTVFDVERQKLMWGRHA